jgi:hypothetical protein
MEWIKLEGGHTQYPIGENIRQNLPVIKCMGETMLISMIAMKSI